MNKVAFQKAMYFVRQFTTANKSVNPYVICSELGIEFIGDKPIYNDGYLVCCDGVKLILVSSKIKNLHRRKFVVSHEIGHFLLHNEQLYCCSNVSDTASARISTSTQEAEANAFAAELLLPETDVKQVLPKGRIDFTTIVSIASQFDVSITSTAIRCVQLSNTEDELLLCYNNGKLAWFSTGDSTIRRSMIPQVCPIDPSKTAGNISVRGAWDSLYKGGVRQEVFCPYEGQIMILLSGEKCYKGEYYYEF